MKKAFATNLRKARKAAGYCNQTQVARLLGLNRSTYQAYEEGRAFPPAEVLVNIADLFLISNLRGFITDHAFDPNNQEATTISIPDSPLQANYAKASPRDRQLVDLILGIGMK
jgi:transcriptional regulator with XRE-family HTH domain